MLLTKPAISTRSQSCFTASRARTGRTVVVGIQDGSMAATLLDGEGAFVLFGSCTTL